MQVINNLYNNILLNTITSHTQKVERDSGLNATFDLHLGNIIMLLVYISIK